MIKNISLISGVATAVIDLFIMKISAVDLVPKQRMTDDTRGLSNVLGCLQAGSSPRTFYGIFRRVDVEFCCK